MSTTTIHSKDVLGQIYTALLDMLTAYESQQQSLRRDLIAAQQVIANHQITIDRLENEISETHNEVRMLAQRVSNLSTLQQEFHEYREDHRARVVPVVGESYITVKDKVVYMRAFSLDPDEKEWTYKGVIVGQGPSRWYADGRNVDYAEDDLREKKP